MLLYHEFPDVELLPLGPARRHTVAIERPSCLASIVEYECPPIADDLETRFSYPRTKIQVISRQEVYIQSSDTPEHLSPCHKAEDIDII